MGPCLAPHLSGDPDAINLTRRSFPSFSELGNHACCEHFSSFVSRPDPPEICPPLIRFTLPLRGKINRLLIWGLPFLYSPRRKPLGSLCIDRSMPLWVALSSYDLCPRDVAVLC